MPPDLDAWLPEPDLVVSHRREAAAAPEELWRAASELRLDETRLLGRLIRWRIPGLARGISFDRLFREPPFLVLEEGADALVSGMAGRIWTLRRDYPRLGGAAEYRDYRSRGTARVLIATWIEPGNEPGRSVLCSESRVEAFGLQGRLGLRAIRPIVRRFAHLVGSDGLSLAVRRAEG